MQYMTFAASNDAERQHVPSIAERLRCFIRALRRGVVVPPLPLYWRALRKVDWSKLAGEPERSTWHGFLAEFKKYAKLREVAEFSPQHEALLIAFMDCGDGAGVPLCPSWWFA